LRAKRFDTGHDVAHALASSAIGLYRLGLLAVTAVRLNALRNDDTSVADLVRRKRH